MEISIPFDIRRFFFFPLSLEVEKTERKKGRRRSATESTTQRPGEEEGSGNHSSSVCPSLLPALSLSLSLSLSRARALLNFVFVFENLSEERSSFSSILPFTRSFLFSFVIGGRVLKHGRSKDSCKCCGSYKRFCFCSLDWCDASRRSCSCYATGTKGGACARNHSRCWCW